LSVRVTALLLTALTGFTGLVYEVAWQRSIATLLGSHSESTAAVLALFLGGLAVGYALFGRVTRRLVARARREGRPPRLLALYGCIEIGIGSWALAFPVFFQWIHALSIRIPAHGEGMAFAIDLALTTLLIAPPTVLMGSTIPILTQTLPRNLDDATRTHALVYGTNTAGAFAGTLAAGFFLIPYLGLEGVLRAMGVVNLAAGAAFLALGLVPAQRSPAAAGEAIARVRGLPAYATAAVLLGFSTLTLQTVLIRLSGLSFGASEFTFAVTVGVFVFCIALGSLVVSTLPRVRPGALVVCAWLFAAFLVALHIPLQDGPYYAHVLRTFFASHDGAFYPYHLASLLSILVVFVIPIALAGSLLPLLFHHLRQEVGALGDVAGRLYAWNTVGSLLGALLGGYALLFWVDLDHVYRIAVGAATGAAAILNTRLATSSRRWIGAAGFALAVLALTTLPAWDPVRLASGPFRSRSVLPVSYRGPDLFFATTAQAKILHYEDDPNSSVAVKELPLSPQQAAASGRRSNRAIVTNGKADGSLVADYPTMALAGILPCLFTNSCERAFVIGYGTGVTAAEIASIRTVEEVVVAEISRGVIDAAPFFDGGNMNASHNPKIQVRHGDAYRTLLRDKNLYDAIVSEPSNPWVTGVEMLFSREFLESARDRLTPSGVFAQWFHAYEIDTATIEMVLRTYRSVFDGVSVWFATGPDLLLLGARQPDLFLDLERLERRVARPDFAAGLRRAGIPNLPALLAHEILPVGVVHALHSEGNLHTLLHPILNHQAARAFFAGAIAGLPSTAHLDPARVGARNSLVQKLALRHGGRLPESTWEAITDQACRTRANECAALLARWRYEQPVSEARTALEKRAQKLFPGHTTDALLDELADFYTADTAMTRSKLTLAEVQRTTRHFENYYTHAAPFRRDRLLAAWQSCQAFDMQCTLAKAQVEERLGRLGTPLGDLEKSP